MLVVGYPRGGGYFLQAYVTPDLQAYGRGEAVARLHTLFPPCTAHTIMGFFDHPVFEQISEGKFFPVFLNDPTASHSGY
jgi:hypothetical protein